MYLSYTHPLRKATQFYEQLKSDSKIKYCYTGEYLWLQPSYSSSFFKPEQAGSWSNNADLYSGSATFESRLGHELLKLRVFFSSLQFLQGNTREIETLPHFFHFIFYVPPLCWRYIFWVNYLFLLLIKRYILCKVLSCSTAFFQLSLSCATFFQLRTFILLISSKTSSSKPVLGLPIGLLDMGFHLLISGHYYPRPCVQHGLTSLIFVF